MQNIYAKDRYMLLANLLIALLFYMISPRYTLNKFFLFSFQCIKLSRYSNQKKFIPIHKIITTNKN